MRTGRGQRVNKDLDNRKEIVELKASISKVKEEMEENAKNQHLEMTKSADKVRLDMCKFIENIKTLIERMADRIKKVEAVLAVVQQDTKNLAGRYQQ